MLIFSTLATGLKFLLPAQTLADHYVDDRHVDDSDELLNERVKKLGQIIIKVHRVKVVEKKDRRLVSRRYKPDVAIDTDSVPEKSLKGRALSCRTGYVLV